MKLSNRDEFLTEYMGECVHIFDIDWDNREFVEKHYCLICNADFNHVTKLNDFSTPNGFFKLWNWSQKQEWWLEFWLQDDLGLQYGLMGMLAFIDPNRFADAVYKFLKEKDNEI